MTDDRWNKTAFFIITVLFLVPLACNFPSTASPSTPTSGVSPTPLVHGPSPSPEPTLTPHPTTSSKEESCIYQAALKSSALPYGAGLQTGANFTQSWTLTNTGTCSWQDAHLQFAGGTRFNGNPQAWQLPRTAPGQKAQVTLNFQAPAQTGTYRGDWQLVNDQGHAFGPQTLPVVVQVSSPIGSKTSTGDGSERSDGGGRLGSWLGKGILATINSLGVMPDPGDLSLYYRHPALASYVNLNRLPDLGSDQPFPDDNYYIDHPPLDMLARFGFTPYSGESDGAQLGNPPQKTAIGEAPKNPDQKLAVYISGTLKVTEYKVFKQRNLKSLRFHRRIILSQDRPSAGFKVSQCVSGNDDKGEIGTAHIGLHRKNRNEVWIGSHVSFSPGWNCATGQKSTTIFPRSRFDQPFQKDEFMIKIAPGEEKSVNRPWVNYPGNKVGSVKINLGFSVEYFDGPVGGGEWVTRRQE